MDGVIQLLGGMTIKAKNADGQEEEQFVREVEFRELAGAEEEIMMDMRKDKKGKFMKSSSDRLTEVLARCTVRVGGLVHEDNRNPEKASPEPFYGVWADALAGDRSVALVRLRQFSLGDVYVWQDVCPACNKQLPRVEFDLSELEVDPYFKGIDKELNDILEKNEDADPEDRVSDESIEELRARNEERRIELLKQFNHEIATPSGRRILYHLMRRKDEERVQSIPEKHPEGMMTAYLAVRISSIDGVPLNSMKDTRMKHMSLRDRDFLRFYFDEVEGGINTRIWVECDDADCHHKFQRPIDPSKPGFFHRLAT